MLRFQNTDKNEFSLFIRNLNENIKTNIFHLIDDNRVVEKKINKKKDNHKKTKTKEEIINEQNKLRHNKNIIEDKKKIQSFDMNDKFPFNNFKLLKTEEMREKYCINLLEYYWNQKNKNMEMILGLYFQYNKTTNPEHRILLDNIKNKLSKYEYKNYILENLGHILPPLNFWKYEKKLDEWQKDAINIIKNNESLFIRAPTSSGKSFIGLSCAKYYKKILYICPAEPVAYQVGSHFQKLNLKVHYLVEDLCINSYDSNCNIFVGTPKYIEEYIYKIGTNFDYAVYDEIHTLDDKYENIIKMLKCNFLALSATVSNIEILINKFKIFTNKEIKLIEYNNRFINIQRWVWTDKLEKVHPLSCIDYNDLNENFLQFNLPFTPNDLSSLWTNIENIFDDEEIEDYIDNLSPENYFNDEDLISLNDIHNYEKYIKKALIYLSSKYPDKTKKLLECYKNEYKIKKLDVIKCLKKSKKKDMFPMLMFTSDESETLNLFEKLSSDLEKLEKINYPYYYDILEKKQELYLDYKNRLDNMSNNIKLKKSTNSLSEKTDILDKFINKETNLYTKNILNYYNSLLEKIENSNTVDNIKKIQKNNLIKEMNKFSSNPDLQYQDIYKKHVDYSFASEPMVAAKIRILRKKINNSLNLKMSYEHSIFQMLKRGVGLYHKSMPKDYKWIIQNLLSNKEISIVISDRELCLGIDLPIRTTCLVGTNDKSFSNSDYLQMSGRAGRRGHDNQGNILFYNIDFKNIMKGQIPVITGSCNTIYDKYLLLSKLNNKIDSNNVVANFINPKRKYVESIKSDNYKINWILRNYYNNSKLETYINNYNANTITCYMHDDSVELLNIICEIMNINSIQKDYMLNKYNDNYKDIIDIIILLYNSNSTKNDILKLLKFTFDKLKLLYIKYINII